jgi:hypothetical protein
MTLAQHTICPTREQLDSDYRRLLSEYHRTLAALLDTRTVDQATDDIQGLYEACVSARKALQQHDQFHRCQKGIRPSRRIA